VASVPPTIVIFTLPSPSFLVSAEYLRSRTSSILFQIDRQVVSTPTLHFHHGSFARRSQLSIPYRGISLDLILYGFSHFAVSCILPIQPEFARPQPRDEPGEAWQRRKPPSSLIKIKCFHIEQPSRLVIERLIHSNQENRVPCDYCCDTGCRAILYGSYSVISTTHLSFRERNI